MAKFDLTEAQRRAVDHRGGAMLISAGAGSGKTRVLVERLMDRICRDGLDIDRFLIITYTRAAAAELRSRILSALAERLRENPADRQLRRQTALVYQAQIGTIHSVCAAILRENAQLCALRPDFRQMDEAEQAVFQRLLADAQLLEAAGCTFLAAERKMVPTTTTEVTDPEMVSRIQRLLDELEDYDDTEAVYHDAELPEDEEEE